MLSLPCELTQWPTGAPCRGGYATTQSDFSGFLESWHQLPWPPLKYFMPTKPVPGGWCCQVLLPVWGIAWPPWTTAVSDSVGWSLWERGKVSWQWAGNPSSCTLLSDTLHFHEFEPLTDRSCPREDFSIFPVQSWGSLCSSPSHLSAPASDAPFSFLGLFFFLTNCTFKNIFMLKLLVFFKLWTYINAVNNHTKHKCFSVLECPPPNKLVHDL